MDNIFTVFALYVLVCVHPHVLKSSSLIEMKIRSVLVVQKYVIICLNLALSEIVERNGVIHQS